MLCKIRFNRDTNIRELLVYCNDNDNQDVIEPNKIDISDGELVKYTALYYPDKTDLIQKQVETQFIGKIHGHHWHYQYGYTGIYIEPEYIYIDDQWKTISNYTYPKTKYFVYPHLLVDKTLHYHHAHGLDFLHTIEETTYSYIQSNNSIVKLETFAI